MRRRFIPRTVTHIPMDSSCSELERERIPTSDFSWQLYSDMGSFSLMDLQRKYPEMVFAFMKVTKAPAGHDYKRKIPGGFVLANWRKV